MDFQLNSTYDDSVFEDNVDQPQTSESQSKENNDVTNEIETEGSDKTVTDSRQRDGESALTVEDTTLDTTLADKIDPGDTGNSVTEAIVADRAGFKNKIHEQLVNRTDVKAIPKNKSKKPKDNLLKLIDTLKSPLSENGTSELPAKKVTISQDTHKPPQASYLRQESDLYSNFSSEFESKNVNNPEEIYCYTGFPSLFSYLGPNATNKTLKDKKKKHKVDSEKLPKTHAQKEHTTFAQEMRKRNESQWLRIEAVAKEKMDLYERYAVDMTIKIKKQREKINRRSQELLTSLARMEEQKKEEKLYDSPHGRIWRHHRSMQRRVFNLEPISVRDKGLILMKQSSAKSGQTGA